MTAAAAKSQTIKIMPLQKCRFSSSINRVRNSLRRLCLGHDSTLAAMNVGRKTTRAWAWRARLKYSSGALIVITGIKFKALGFFASLFLVVAFCAIYGALHFRSLLRRSLTLGLTVL